MPVCRRLAWGVGSAVILGALASSAANATPGASPGPTSPPAPSSSTPRGLKSFSVGAGPLVQIGGPVPSLYHAGGMVNLSIRSPMWLWDLGTTFAVAVVPEERFLAPMRGYDVSLFAHVGVRPWEFFGVFAGARIGDWYGWNETPRGPLESKGSSGAGLFGAEFYWRFAPKLAFRVLAEGGYTFAKPTLRVDARFTQIWGPPFPVFGVLSMQIIYDIMQYAVKDSME